MTQYPPLQIVNEADQPVGGASLRETYARGLWHRVVFIFVEDTAGKILFQKRGPNVATNANKWDFSAAGHVETGDSYLTAAQKELDEELGLRGFELKEVDTLRLSSAIDSYNLNRFARVFKVVIPPDTPITIGVSEVSAVQWLDVPAAIQFAESHPDQVTSDLLEYLKKYYEP